MLVAGGGAQAEKQQRLGEAWILRLRSACCCWIEQIIHCSLATVHAKQMEIFLSILLVVVGLSFNPFLNA
jgi:hypothetical protein